MEKGLKTIAPAKFEKKKEGIAMDLKQENDEKKDYLRKYVKHLRRAQRIGDEIIELRSMKMYPSSSGNGMPRSNSGTSDLSGYAAEIEYKITKLKQEQSQRVDWYKKINEQIGEIEDENERDVLFYRYIRCLDFWEIAERMKYTERHIHRIHAQALKHFKIPEKMSQNVSKMS